MVQMQYCRTYYLKYPLDGLLRGFVVFGYFLSEVQWKLDHYLYSALSDIFPNIIHVNQPTDADKLKQLSMFLYFSAYSIKQFLNQDITIFRQQMIKIFPQFQHIQNNWTSSQNTVGQILNLRMLNKFYMEAQKIKNMGDYNFCVDKILQISPCYDITAKGQKTKEYLNFGFMEMNDGIGGGMNIHNSHMKQNQDLNYHHLSIGNGHHHNHNGHILSRENTNSLGLGLSLGINLNNHLNMYFHSNNQNDEQHQNQNLHDHQNNNLSHLNHLNQLKMQDINMDDFKEFDGEI